MPLSFMKYSPHEGIIIINTASKTCHVNNLASEYLSIPSELSLYDFASVLEKEDSDKILEIGRSGKETPLEKIFLDVIRNDVRYRLHFFHVPETDNIIIHVKNMKDYDTIDYQLREYTEGLVTNTVRLEMYHRELEKRNLDLIEELKSREVAEQLLQQSLDNQRRIVDEMIRTLSLIGIIRDPYTGAHQQRVAVLAKTIAREMNLHFEQVQGIYVAAMLHDIGKISVPSEILSKPGEISEEELLLIRTHPKISYKILQEIEFPWPVARAAYQHHEKMDGSGYPQGLTAEEITLEARIIAVADTVEAISSHRPYRASKGIEAALEIIEEGRGHLYDPEIVDVCIRLFRENNFSFEASSPFI